MPFCKLLRRAVTLGSSLHLKAEVNEKGTAITTYSLCIQEQVPDRTVRLPFLTAQPEAGKCHIRLNFLIMLHVPPIRKGKKSKTVPLTLYSKGKTKQEGPKPFPLHHRLSGVVLSQFLDPSTFNIQTAALKAKSIPKGALNLRHTAI